MITHAEKQRRKRRGRVLFVTGYYTLWVLALFLFGLWAWSVRLGPLWVVEQELDGISVDARILNSRGGGLNGW